MLEVSTQTKDLQADTVKTGDGLITSFSVWVNSVGHFSACTAHKFSITVMYLVFVDLKINCIL